jgi:polar amino acid transport system permease protein
MPESTDTSTPVGVTGPDGEVTERYVAGSIGSYARTGARWLVRLVVLVLLAMLVHLLLTSKSIQWHVVGHYFTHKSILLGVLRTLELTVLGMAIGVSLGLVLALMRLSHSALLKAAASLFLWFFRGTPLLVQVLFWFNLASFIKRISIGIPFGPSLVSWDTNSLITPFVAAILALGLNQAAYMCEIVRAGILSVDPGQLEASLTLGMTTQRAMRRVVLPQAMRIIIPPTANHAIGLLKDSSLVSVISMTELLYSAQIIYANTFQTIPLLIVASLWYLLMTTVTSTGQFYLERHFGRGSGPNAPQSLSAQLRQGWAGSVSSVWRRGGQPS